MAANFNASGFLDAIQPRLWFARHALWKWWWPVILAVWTAFSTATTIRDNLLSLDMQKRFATIALLPHWGWKEWALGALAIAILAALEGGYRLWKAERQGREPEITRAKELVEAERAKNALPDLTGGIEEAFIEIHPTGGSTAETYFLLKVRVANQRSANATIRRASLILQTNDFCHDLESIRIPESLVVMRLVPKLVGVKSVANEVKDEHPSERQLLDIIDREKLPRGEGKTGWLLFRFADVLLSKEVAEAKRILRLTDDFGKEHRIEGKPAEWSDRVTWLR